jgi:PKD repeat protein
VAWTANFDYDNSDLTYAVLRDNLQTPVGTVNGTSTWWQRPAMSFTDTGVPGGQHSYRVRVSDRFGNSVTSPSVSITIAGSGNTPPVASFTTSVTNRTVSVNGSASGDPGGSITGYQWNWGDGQTGTGVTNSHTYAADGTYTITLTVTDNLGAQGSTTRTVAVGNAPAVLASDTFGRTVASGFGTADTGGPWSTNGSSFSVNGSMGVVTVNTAGQGPWARLAGVSSTATEVTAAVRLDKIPNAGGAFFGTIGRRVGSADYRLKVKVEPNGAVVLYAVRQSGGETTLVSTPVAGLTYTAGAQLNTRLQVTGTSPTTIRGKVWLSTANEPANWQVSASDSTAALQSAGAVGLFTYVSGSAGNAPWPFRFDDYVARPAG